MTLFYDFGDGEFEYELEGEQEKKAIEFIASQNAKVIKSRASETEENITKAIIQSFIEDNNLEQYVLKYYEDELEDYFYDEAELCWAETLNDMGEYYGI